MTGYNMNLGFEKDHSLMSESTPKTTRAGKGRRVCCCMVCVMWFKETFGGGMTMFSSSRSENIVTAKTAATFSRTCSGLLASLGCATVLLMSNQALAQTAPNLGTNGSFAVVSNTLSSGGGGGGFMNGDVCYTTAPAAPPTYSSPPQVPCGPGTNDADFDSALADVNGQACTNVGPGAISLDA